VDLCGTYYTVDANRGRGPPIGGLSKKTADLYREKEKTIKTFIIQRGINSLIEVYAK